MSAAHSPVPAPPDPFDPEIHDVLAGTSFYRVAEADPNRTLATPNPGFGEPTRFAFFGDPVVPVIYAAATQEAAVCETLLHDVPVTGGRLSCDAYSQRVMGRVVVTRDLRLASLKGTGLRRLKITAQAVPSAPARYYGLTVAWAQAAYDAGLDGLAWMSYRCNDALAVVLFERDGEPPMLDVDPSFGRIFQTPAGHAWLVDMCGPLHVDVMPPA